MKVRFTRRYDHVWPSRAMTCFPAGWVGPVKREVAERAIAKGAAVRYVPPRAAKAEGLTDD